MPPLILRKFTKTCSPEIPSAQIPPYGRMVYTYPEKELRTYPGTLRGTPEWESTYKIRTAVERSIHHIKEPFGLAGRKTQNKKTLHADLVLSGITQLVTVLLADKMHQHQYIRSVKSIIA